MAVDGEATALAETPHPRLHWIDGTRVIAVTGIVVYLVEPALLSHDTRMRLGARPAPEVAAGPRAGRRSVKEAQHAGTH